MFGINDHTHLFTVSAYEVSRHFGGPEEGGWWYDRSAFQGVIVSGMSEAGAYSVARCLNEGANAERKLSSYYGGIDRYSAASDRLGLNGDESYFVEAVPGESDDWNEPRPHYC